MQTDLDVAFSVDTRAGSPVPDIGFPRAWRSSSCRCLPDGDSDVILRYVADAPLVNMTRDLLGSSCSSKHCLPSASVASKLGQHMSDAQKQLDDLRSQVVQLSKSLQPAFVQNRKNSVWHNVLLGGVAYPPHNWKNSLWLEVWCCRSHHAGVAPTRRLPQAVVLPVLSPGVGSAACLECVKLFI